MREKGDGERRLQDCQPGIIPECPQVTAGDHAAAPRDDGGEHGEQCRQREVVTTTPVQSRAASSGNDQARQIKRHHAAQRSSRFDADPATSTARTTAANPCLVGSRHRRSTNHAQSPRAHRSARATATSSRREAPRPLRCRTSPARADALEQSRRSAIDHPEPVRESRLRYRRCVDPFAGVDAPNRSWFTSAPRHCTRSIPSCWSEGAGSDQPYQAMGGERRPQGCKMAYCRGDPPGRRVEQRPISRPCCRSSAARLSRRTVSASTVTTSGTGGGTGQSPSRPTKLGVGRRRAAAVHRAKLPRLRFHPVQRRSLVLSTSAGGGTGSSRSPTDAATRAVRAHDPRRPSCPACGSSAVPQVACIGPVRNLDECRRRPESQMIRLQPIS